MDPNRVSACTYPLREQSLDVALGTLARAGFTYVDLWGRAPHFSTIPSRVKPRDIEKACAAHGVRIANLATYPGGNLTHRDRAIRHQAMAEMTRTIDLAVRFGARCVRVMAGGGDDPKLIRELSRPLRQAAVYAASKGVYLGVENHAGSLARDPELALELCKAVDNSHFGILYDPCNLLHAGVDPKAAFETLKEHIVHIHIKDGAWVNGEFQLCHLGQGQVDIPWIVAAMEGIGYDGYYALEYEMTEIEPLETGLPRWREYLEGL